MHKSKMNYPPPNETRQLGAIQVCQSPEEGGGLKNCPIVMTNYTFVTLLGGSGAEIWIFRVTVTF